MSYGSVLSNGPTDSNGRVHFERKLVTMEIRGVYTHV